jgi:hypothetical protein
MTILQEMVAALFSLDVIQQAKNQFELGRKITPVEKFDISFRLFKVDDDTINFECMLRRRFGPINQVEMGKVQSVVTYFKPIGVYKRSFYSEKFHIIILNEFKDDYLKMISDGAIESQCEIEILSLEENAVIGAFSMDAVIEAEDRQDKKVKINGLDMEIFMANDGYPQIFLDDKYGLNGPIAAYFATGPNSLNPMVSNKAIFDDLKSRSLLTAYKAI